jgi:hypothetical protein
MLGEKWLKHSADYPVYVPRLVHRAARASPCAATAKRWRPRPGPPSISTSRCSTTISPRAGPNGARGICAMRPPKPRASAGRGGAFLRALVSRDRADRRAALRALSYRLPGRPALRFLYAYVLRLGFLDGREGLAFCRAMAAYERMIDAALRRRPNPPRHERRADQPVLSAGAGADGNPAGRSGRGTGARRGHAVTVIASAAGYGAEAGAPAARGRARGPRRAGNQRHRSGRGETGRLSFVLPRRLAGTVAACRNGPMRWCA